MKKHQKNISLNYNREASASFIDRMAEFVAEKSLIIISLVIATLSILYLSI
jgi:hypothetical protein